MERFEGITTKNEKRLLYWTNKDIMLLTQYFSGENLGEPLDRYFNTLDDLRFWKTWKL